MWSAVLNRLSLRSVLIVNVIVPLLFAMALATWFGFRTVEHIVEARLQEDVQLVAMAIRLPVSCSLEKNVSAASVRPCSRFSISEGFTGPTSMIRKEGALRRWERLSRSSSRKGSGMCWKAASAGGQYEKIEGRRVYSYFVPLFDSSGKTNGMLQITRK